jgi:hypothetical protein
MFTVAIPTEAVFRVKASSPAEALARAFQLLKARENYFYGVNRLSAVGLIKGGKNGRRSKATQNGLKVYQVRGSADEAKRAD